MNDLLILASLCVFVVLVGWILLAVGLSNPLLFAIVFIVMLCAFHFSFIVHKRTKTFWTVSQYLVLGVAVLGFVALAQEGRALVETRNRQALEALASLIRKTEVDRARERAAFHWSLYAQTHAPEQEKAARWFEAQVDALTRDLDLALWRRLQIDTLDVKSVNLIIRHQSESVLGMQVLDRALNRVTEMQLDELPPVRELFLRLLVLVLAPVLLAFEITKVTAELRGHC